jgi:hypothetical protein
MAEGARVDSIEVLKHLKLALLKFQEAASVALGDAESEMTRIHLWLTTEQDSYWQHQIRKREEIVNRCKEAVRMKTIFKDATGRQQSAIDEQKALRIAQKQLEEAQQKLAAVRKWARVLPKEIEMYKGSVQRFATTVESQIPVAAAHLEKLSGKLEAYVSLQFAGNDAVSGDGSGTVAGGPSMARGGVAIASIPPDELSILSAQIPSHETREQAPLISEARLRIPEIPTEHRAPAMLPVTYRAPLSAEARVFIAKTSADPAKLFVHRHPERLSPLDSGWSIAPAERIDNPQWEAIAAGDLLKARPDLADLLGLPAGFSVIIDSAGISDVIDARRQPAWRRT